MKRRDWMAGAGLAWMAASQPVAAAAATASPRSMQVEAVQMPAWRHAGAGVEPLAPGDTVTTSDDVETGEDAGLVLRLPEQSVVRIGTRTRLRVLGFEALEADGQVEVRAEYKLLQGFFRFATSALSNSVGRRQVRLGLATATAGIRGTDYWAMTDAVHDAACVFEGRVALETRDQGDLVLDRPTAFWARFFDQPVRPVGNATPEELARFLGSTELKPGRGVAVAGGRFRVVAAAAATPAAAQGLAKSLRQAGYPATVKAVRQVHEVRIDGLASRADAQAILDKIAGMEGVRGRVALRA